MEDRVYASVLYEDGLIASHYHAFARPGFFERTTQRFVYDLAEIEIEGWVPLKGKIWAIVNEDTESKLDILPNFVTTDLCHVNEANDHSRPDGWGGLEAQTIDRRKLRSGCKEYEAEKLISGTFHADGNKGEVYQSSLRALMTDFVTKVKDPSHKLRVTLEDGLRSLHVARRATDLARKIDTMNKESP